MNSSTFANTELSLKTSAQSYPSQILSRTLNIILLLVLVSPAFIGQIRCRKSKKGVCALIRFVGGGSLTLRRGEMLACILSFLFLLVLLLTAWNAVCSCFLS